MDRNLSVPSLGRNRMKKTPESVTLGKCHNHILFQNLHPLYKVTSISPRFWPTSQQPETIPQVPQNPSSPNLISPPLKPAPSEFSTLTLPVPLSPCPQSGPAHHTSSSRWSLRVHRRTAFKHGVVFRLPCPLFSLISPHAFSHFSTHNRPDISRHTLPQYRLFCLPGASLFLFLLCTGVPMSALLMAVSPWSHFVPGVP